MFDDLTGPLKFVAAFAFVLLLIGIAAWLVRRFGATRVDAAARGRQPRLAVIDSAAVDGRRKLVIIRRDPDGATSFVFNFSRQLLTHLVPKQLRVTGQRKLRL